MSFTNNLRSIHPSQATFIKATHGGNADKFLVCNSQDKGHVCEEKLEKHDKNEVSLHIDITTLASQLKPLENKLLMKINHCKTHFQ